MKGSLSKANGDQGESIAREYLRAKGWKFIEANWKCKVGEIDLIFDPSPASILQKAGRPSFAQGVGRAQRAVVDPTLVFVEVKTRKPNSYGKGEDAVAWQKQNRLAKAALWYCQEMEFWGDVRFDVIAIEMGEGEPIINHIEDAFETS